MKKKTLHDITGISQKSVDGAIPSAFHRHGKVVTDYQTLVQSNDGYNYDIGSEELKMYGYSIIAAGDAMVPYQSSNGDVALRSALREAVATNLSAHVTSQGFPPLRVSPKTPFDLAIHALRHHGTENERAALKAATTFLRQKGYRMQAKMLHGLIGVGVETALTGTTQELEEFYFQFHLLYGRQENQWPDKPEVKPAPVEIPEKPKEEPPLNTGRRQALNWGKMLEEQIPLHPWKHPRIRSQRYWKYSEFGVFKYPWRALPTSDMQCFSVARRKYGGTVLIDMSGSMGIQNAHISALLDKAPFATIAGYGGAKETDSYGVLVLMAQDSMKGDATLARSYIGKGNVVDGPALRWLASQAAPRIWVSDGAVTGVDDQGGPQYRADAAKVVTAANIHRIGSMVDLIAKLQ